MAIVLRFVGRDCAFAAVDDLSISIWVSPPSASTISAQREVLEALLTTHRKLRALTVLQMNGVALDAALRAVRDGDVWSGFSEIVSMIDGSLQEHALVVEGTGFGNALGRSLATALTVRFRHKVKAACFDRVEDGAAYLVPNELDREAAVRQVARLRAEITQARGAHSSEATEQRFAR